MSATVNDLQIEPRSAIYFVNQIQTTTTVYWFKQNDTALGASKGRGTHSRQEAMAFISKCCICDCMKFNWWQVFEPIDNEWQPCTCTKCVDQKNIVWKTKCVVSLYKMRIPREVFEFATQKTDSSELCSTDVRDFNMWKTCGNYCLEPHTRKRTSIIYIDNWKDRYDVVIDGKTTLTEQHAGTPTLT